MVKQPSQTIRLEDEGSMGQGHFPKQKTRALEAFSERANTDLKVGLWS